MEIRKATLNDVPRMMEIYAIARDFMKTAGNPTQWGTTHPHHDRLVKDIEEELLFVIEDPHTIHGVFYLYIGEDPTYANIQDGCWHSDRLYGTIHRIAGDGSGGILRTAVDYASGIIEYLRIDTHHDNTVMQNAVQKVGFQRCGIIYVEDGTPRIAYDRI